MLANSQTQLQEQYQKHDEQDNAVPMPSGNCRNTPPSFEIMIKKVLFTQTCGATRQEIQGCIRAKFGIPPECNKVIKETIEQMLDAGLLYKHHYTPVRYKLTPKGRTMKSKPHYKRKRKRSVTKRPSVSKSLCRYPAQSQKKQASRSVSKVSEVCKQRKSRSKSFCKYHSPSNRSHSSFCQYGKKRPASSKIIVNRARIKRPRKHSMCRYPAKQQRRVRSVSKSRGMTCKYKPPKQRSRSVSRRRPRSSNRMICKYRPKKRSQSANMCRYKRPKQRSSQRCRYKPPRQKSRSISRRLTSTRGRRSMRRSASNFCRYKPRKRSNFCRYKPIKRSQQRSRSFCKYKPKMQMRRPRQKSRSMRNFCRYKPVRKPMRQRQSFCRYKPQQKARAICKYKPPKQQRRRSVCRYVAPARKIAKAARYKPRSTSRPVCRYAPPKAKKPRSKGKGPINVCRYRPAALAKKGSGIKPKKMTLCKYLAKSKKSSQCKYQARSRSKENQCRYKSPQRAKSPTDKQISPKKSMNKPSSICKYPENEEKPTQPPPITCKKCGKKKQQP